MSIYDLYDDVIDDDGDYYDCETCSGDGRVCDYCGQPEFGCDCGYCDLIDCPDCCGTGGY